MWADNCVKFCLLLISVSMIKLSIFPAKTWIRRKTTERCTLRVSKSSPLAAISIFAKSKFTTPNSCKASITKIESVQIKPIQISNVLKSRIQTIAIQQNNESKIMKHQIQNKFKEGHCTLSYSQSSFSVQSSLYIYSYLSSSSQY